MKKNKIIAIIPARGGSKGVPKKNVRLLAGHPLIAFSIGAAKLCKNIDRVIVSTDNSEIADIARNYAAEVPFLRPAEYASDSSPDSDFITHALNWLQENEQYEPDLIIHLRPTTPLRVPELIDDSINKFVKNDHATSLRSAHELPEPPQKMFAIQDGYFVGLYPEDPRPEYYNLPRQVFPKVYHPNGYVDIIRSQIVKSNKTLHGSFIQAFVTPYAIEIDQEHDFQQLEFMVNSVGHPLCEYLNCSTSLST